MISVICISIEGMSEAGPFAGSLSFGEGVQVISGHNRFGKSTAFAGIVWCLGVEHIFGVQAADNAIFPDAPRARLQLGDAADIRVISSFASLELERADGKRLKLRRDIVGETGQVHFDDGEVDGTLVVGHGSMKDPTAGFQSALRRWIGIPEARLMTSRGGEAQIYLENLAPLFMIEQLRGWSDLQAEQVHRYGTQEIADGSFEFLLGLDNQLAARLLRQRSEASAAALRQEARSIAAYLTELLKKQGWTFDIGTHSTLANLATRWSELDLLALIRETFHFDPDKEITRLAKRAEDLRTRVTKGKPDPEATSEVSSASGAVVTLKQRRHELQLRLAILRSQLRDQQRLLHTVEDRNKSAKDLWRLKAEGIGILPKAECPTCRQVVDPDMLQVNQQSTESLQMYISQLDHQRKLLSDNVDTVRAEVVEASAQAEILERDFVHAERTLQLVNTSTSPQREAVIKAANDLLAVEQELAKNRGLQEDLRSIEARMKGWAERARGALAPSEGSTDQTTTDTFLTRLRHHLVALGCAGVTANEAPQVQLDEHYLPILRGRWVRSLGSASDRARLIVAYTLALSEVGKHHPGFVAFDEPLQQNPDRKHRDRFMNFLLEQGSAIKQQVLVFTSLHEDELMQLRATGIDVQKVDGKFLQPITEVGPLSDAS